MLRQLPVPLESLKSGAAPSVSLLRFLRSQSDSVPFFTAKPTLHAPRSLRGGSFSKRSCGGLPFTRVSCQQQPTVALTKTLFSNGTQGANTDVLRRRRIICHQSFGQKSDWFRLKPSQQTRSLSTRRPLLRRLLDLKRSKAAAWKADNNNKPKNNGPFVDDVNLFNINRSSLGGKTPNEPRLRCTEFDNTGNVTLVNGEFKKSELIAKVRPYLDSAQGSIAEEVANATL